MCTKSGSIVKLDGHKVSIFRMKCKSWSCSECAPMRRKALISQAAEGSPTRFITLTVNPAWFDSPEDRAARLAKAWRGVVAAFRARWKRRESEYLCIFEATKRGEPHLHIVWRGAFMPQKWLSAQMEKRMGAPVVDVRRVRNRSEVLNYITKYISKRPIRFGTCKRYWSSGGYLTKSPRQLRRERNAGCYFWISPKHVLEFAEQAIIQGITVSIWGDHKVEFELPEKSSHPPGLWLQEAAYIEPRAAQAA